MVSLAHSLLRSDTEEDARAAFARDVVSGLTASRKTLRPKYFYDEEGSRLFEEITRVPEYYPTRTEIGILEKYGRDIAQLIPAGGALVEFGSGSSVKIRTILRALDKLEVYVPVDISADFLAGEAADLQSDFPRVRVLPVAADFTRPFALPAMAQKRPRVGFFPGSTIGNFEPDEAEGFLDRCATLLGPGSGLVIGVDLRKDLAVLDAAYNDAQGVTAEFNLNLLERMNRELDGDFVLSRFAHEAFYDEREARIEIYIRSLARQRVRVAGRTFVLDAGERIHTEYSYKYDIETFQRLAGRAGFYPEAAWTDPRALFSVHFLRVA